MSGLGLGGARGRGGASEGETPPKNLFIYFYLLLYFFPFFKEKSNNRLVSLIWVAFVSAPHYHVEANSRGWPGGGWGVGVALSHTVPDAHQKFVFTQ